LGDIPDDRRYTKEHEWAREDGGRFIVGITEYAQDQLGDIVFVQLPDPGTEVTAGEPLGEVESTKSVSDVYSPVSGKVVEKNAEAESNPQIVNEDPYGQGWLVAIEAAGDQAEMLDAAGYKAFTESSGA
jgi:glycine cleavage system H protein